MPGQGGPSADAPIGSGNAAKTDGKAIGSLVSGIFGFLLFPAFVVAIVLGHMSRSQIRKSDGRLKGSGMALAGLILGYSGVALIPVILIIAAIAIPNLLRAKIAANEASAVSVIRTINIAEAGYRSASGNYACALSSLGTTQDSARTIEDALIDSDIASGHKHGYRFEIQNCNTSNGATQKYQVIAYPETRNQTGVRAFCSDESGVIRLDPQGSTDDCLSNGAALR